MHSASGHPLSRPELGAGCWVLGANCRGRGTHPPCTRPELPLPWIAFGAHLSLQALCAHGLPLSTAETGLHGAVPAARCWPLSPCPAGRSLSSPTCEHVDPAVGRCSAKFQQPRSWTRSGFRFPPRTRGFRPDPSAGSLRPKGARVARGREPPHFPSGRLGPHAPPPVGSPAFPGPCRHISPEIPVVAGGRLVCREPLCSQQQRLWFMLTHARAPRHLKGLASCGISAV